MTQNLIIAFTKHVVKRNTKLKRVRIPAMTGLQLDQFLRAMERARGYSI